jgi:hypothetical protein
LRRLGERASAVLVHRSLRPAKDPAVNGLDVDKVWPATVRGGIGRRWMTARRAKVLAAVAGALAIVGLWRLFAGPARETRVSRPATPSPTRQAAAASPPATPGPAEGYRLAGVAGGEERSFVAVELPDGSTELFRLGDDVPGLGRLTRVEDKRATFEGTDGAFSMQVAAKPTPSEELRDRLPSPAETAITVTPF